MKKLILIATIAMVAATIPAHAQGFDWLTPHLDAQRFGNQLRHNQRVHDNQRRNSTERSRTHKTSAPKRVVRHPRVQVNGQMLQTSVAPMEINGHTFVPMRSILEALGFTVTHDSEKNLVTAKRGSSVMKISLPGSSDNALDNEKSFDAGEMPFIHHGVTMLPLRKISETVGAQVAYIPHANPPLINITSKTG